MDTEINRIEPSTPSSLFYLEVKVILTFGATNLSYNSQIWFLVDLANNESVQDVSVSGFSNEVALSVTAEYYPLELNPCKCACKPKHSLYKCYRFSDCIYKQNFISHIENILLIIAITYGNHTWLKTKDNFLIFQMTQWDGLFYRSKSKSDMLRQVTHRCFLVRFKIF